MDEFFARLDQAGVLVRKRYSTVNPREITRYAAGLPQHVSKTGGTIWYGGGKLAADLTLPKLRARWAAPAQERFGAGIPGVAARAVLRSRVADAAGQARDEAGFFGQLRENGLLVRLRSARSIRSRSPDMRWRSLVKRMRTERPAGTGEGDYPPS